MKELKKRANKAKVTIEQAQDIIVEHHYLNNIVDPKTLEEVELDLNGESYKKLKAIASNLNVDIDSVVCSLLREYIKSQEKKKK